MSIQAVAWALEQSLPRGPKLVLVSIANHANHTDGYCWLNATTIGREASCTPRSVYNIVGALIRNGFIRKELRRGEDGKQRANDYWILFDRAQKEWDWGAHPDKDEAEGDSAGDASSEPDDTTSGEPSETISLGEPSETRDTRQPVEKHAVSLGPSEVGFTRKRIAEPSKTNPKEERAGARTFGSYRPRGYAPPPPQPLGAVTEQPKQQIFVYEGSRAWDAWVNHIKATQGRSWNLTSAAFIEGKYRTGWWFPTLFPPPTEAADKNTAGLTESEAREFRDTG